MTLSPQSFRKEQLRKLPDLAGVYALCDLDGVPIYVGQAQKSRDTSIRKRVQRHLTSARSDVIANRQLDVWEIAYVKAWVAEEPAERLALEATLFHIFDRQSQLVNGTVPLKPTKLSVTAPRPAAEVQVMPEELRNARLEPTIRFPRQVSQFNQLLDYVLNVQDKAHLRRALAVHHERLNRYLKAFLQAPPAEPDDGDEKDE